MAFNPVSSNINYVGAGQYIGEALGSGLASLGSMMGKSMEEGASFIGETKKKKDAFSFMTDKAVDDIPGEDLVIENHKLWADAEINNIKDQVSQWMQVDDTGNKKNPFAKGTLTAKQQARFATEIKRINLGIEERQTAHQSYLKARETIIKDKDGYYDQSLFKETEKQYFETGLIPETGFLEQGAINFDKYLTDYKKDIPFRLVTSTSNGKEVTTKIYNKTQPEIVADISNDYDNNLGYRKFAKGLFGNSDVVDEKTRAEYYDFAGIAMGRTNKEGIDKANVDAQYSLAAKTWAQQKLKDVYLRPEVTRIEEVKPTKEEEVKFIPKTGDSYKFNDKPITLTGVKGTGKATVTELVENPEGKPGLYFKAIVPAKQVEISATSSDEEKFMLEEQNRLSKGKYEVEYIPYNEIKELVKYKFEGIENYKMPATDLSRPEEKSPDFNANFGKQSEVLRKTPDGRVAVFDSVTKKFIRWEK